jgi:pimeloyl-ACP methyl ester carboxylesterase
MTKDVDSQRDGFERKRLGFMADQGFDGEGRRIVARSSRSTYVMVSGEGTPSRLLIHGGLSEGSVWAVLAGRLDGRIVVADRPGCGLSDPVDYRKVDSYRDAAAEWADEVVESLGEDQVDVVGNSMGGYFAIAFAAAHPKRVRRLVLIGHPAGLGGEVPVFFRLWANPVTERIIRRLKFKDVDQFRSRVYPTLVAHPERVPKGLAEVEFAAGNLPDFSLTAYTMFRSLISLRGWRADQMLVEALTSLKTPTLFVWGASDLTAPPSKGQPIADRMLNAEFEVIEDAGHMPWIDQPDQVAHLVNDFLDSRAAPSEGTDSAR